MSVVDTLSEARALIAVKGLAHTVYWDADTGCFCSVGALCATKTGGRWFDEYGKDSLDVAYHDDDVSQSIELLAEVIREQTGRDGSPPALVFGYNDASDKDTVLALFDAAIARAS